MLSPLRQEEEMLRFPRIALLGFSMAALTMNANAAQTSSGADHQSASTAAAPAAPAVNPISSTVKAQLTRFGKNMVAAAEAMPAEKFNFKPTPEMNSFAHLVMHIAQSNNGLCSKISDTPTPEAKLADTDPKDKLVAGLKASFDFCASALEKVDDSKLGDQMMLFGNRPFSRAAVLIILSDDWYDHYGAQATYLRLNGILPPTAQTAPK